MPAINENIVVIGGGYAGMLSAIQLKMAGYKDVTVLEKNSAIFRGPSRDAFRLHLGGEYPQDSTTGNDCLKGAITFKQMFPSDVFTPVPPVNFLVAQDTEIEEKVTVDKFIAYYEGIKSSYEVLCSQYADESNRAGEPLSPEAVHSTLFGAPADFYTRLKPEEYDYADGVAGGFRSKEEGINPIYVLQYIEEIAQKLGIKIHGSHEVTSVVHDTVSGKFQLAVTNVDDAKTIVADQVINASWQSAFALNHTVAPDLPMEEVKIFLRAMALVDISQIPGAQQPQKDIIPPTFVMNGESGGMYCPINDKIAAIYFPSEKGAYIESSVLSKDTPTIPEHWKRWMAKNGYPNADTRLDNILEGLQEGRFPFLEKATTERLLVHPTISYDGTDLSKRRDAGAQEIVPGFYSAVPTKATYAARTSLIVLQKALAHSVHRGHIVTEDAEKIIPSGDIPARLPKHLSIAGYLEAESLKNLELLAERTGLPTNMASAGRKVTTINIVGVDGPKRSGSTEALYLVVESLTSEEKAIALTSIRAQQLADNRKPSPPTQVSAFI